MGLQSFSSLLEMAIPVIREAGKIALDPPIPLDVATKSGRNDLVTAVDKYLEDFIAQKLYTASGYPLMGEEGHQVDSLQGRIWVLDPIDGTLNYVYTRRDWAISLALYEEGIPQLGIILDPTANILYTAVRGGGAYKNGIALPTLGKQGLEDGVLITSPYDVETYPFLRSAIAVSRGQRRYGAAALECAEVASGQAAAFVHSHISPWDIGAALVLGAETGACVERIDGSAFVPLESGSIIYAWPQVAKDLQKLQFPA